MAQSKTKKANTRKNTKKAAKKFKLNLNFFKKGKRGRRRSKMAKDKRLVSNAFIASVALNLVLFGALMWAFATPTTYKDASTGYKISYPGDWIRKDTNNGAFSAVFTKDDKEARIFAYGQRGAAAQFFAQTEEFRSNALDDLIDLFNSGVNQFLLPEATLQDAEYKAVREPRDNGDEAIRIIFSGTNNDGEKMVGEHLILITKDTGSVYNAVALAEETFWPEVQFTAKKIINSLVETRN